jgi:hypothetical protein
VTARSHILEPSTPAPQQPGQRRWKFVFIALVVAIPVLIGAWIVSANGHPATAPAASCQAVSAALANGPDPGADPVGYAEAQVLPLRDITTSDAGLHSAIVQLSSAYESFYKDNGAASSKKLVSAAEKSVDHYCPGATS